LTELASPNVDRSWSMLRVRCRLLNFARAMAPLIATVTFALLDALA
jgi:hypothetical protein